MDPRSKTSVQVSTDAGPNTRSWRNKAGFPARHYRSVTDAGSCGESWRTKNVSSKSGTQWDWSIMGLGYNRTGTQ